MGKLGLRGMGRKFKNKHSPAGGRLSLLNQEPANRKINLIVFSAHNNYD